MVLLRGFSKFPLFVGLFLILLLMFPPMQNASSFTPTISDNGPTVNQEDHDDDDYDCDPAYEDCTTDSDGDGSPDWDDDCPNEPGSYENYGCPDGVTHNDTDSDGDGVDDEFDFCPNEYGTRTDGCPQETDSDSDGVPDSQDNCPNEYGTRTDGCPQETDSDSDGVPDSQDNCPNTGNPDQADFNNDGSGDVCSDADGDGYFDSFDQCPLEYAYADPNDDGCLDDSDGDGVPDNEDSCPNEYGTQSNGCPVVVVTDSDGDGVPDNEDSCPTVYGTQSNGCPVIVQPPPDGSIVVNFDSVNTNGGYASGSTVNNYLADYGITVIDEGSGPLRDFVIWKWDRNIGIYAIATSDSNGFFRNFGNEAYSYSFYFDNPLDRFEFTRASYDATEGGIATSPWNAQAFDIYGNSLGTVGEGSGSYYFNTRYS